MDGYTITCLVSLCILAVLTCISQKEVGTWSGQYKVKGRKMLYHSDIGKCFLLLPTRYGEERLIGIVKTVVTVQFYDDNKHPTVTSHYFPVRMSDEQILKFIGEV